jgi:hypothetical protein
VEAWIEPTTGRSRSTLRSTCAETTTREVLAQYRREIELANAIVSARSLDAPPAWWPTEIFPDLPRRDLRRTILHVITETACHAGHLDAVRELIDGHTWQVLE